MADRSMRIWTRAGYLEHKHVIIGASLMLALGGLVMIYSAASANDYVEFGDSAYHLKRQAIFLVAGLVALYVLSRFDYRRLATVAWTTLFAVDGLLILVLFAGVRHGGARSWLLVGPVTLQPSELAKLACVLAMALVMTEKGRDAERLRLWRAAAIVAPVIALVMMQPDMGTAMSIMVAVFLVAWLSGLSWKVTGALVGSLSVAVVAAILSAPYRLQRWTAFLDPWADPLDTGYQTVQSILAFASGGLTGVGLGLSRQKFSYLPEAHTDFILSIVGEELGLIGTLAIVAAFVVLAVSGFRITMKAKDPFGRALAGGLTAMIASQALMNMFAVTNLMPVTGIPLPFVSYGGNSLLVSLASVGLIASVSEYGGRLPARSGSPSKPRRKRKPGTPGGGRVRPRREGGRDASTAVRRRNSRSRVSGARGR